MNPHDLQDPPKSPIKTRSAYMENQRSIPLQLPIALTFGDRPALILQQIRYWMRIHEESESRLPEDQRAHYKDGRWWVYNSYEDWVNACFGFWSQKTLERHIRALEKAGVLISRMFGQASGDRTKWYTIDFDVLDSLVEEHVGTVQTTPSGQNVLMGASGQNDEMVTQDHQDKMSRSFIESTDRESTIGKGANAPLSGAGAPDARRVADTDSASVQTGASVNAGEERSAQAGEPPPKKKRERSDRQKLNDEFVQVIACKAWAAQEGDEIDPQTFKRIGMIISAVREKWPAITPLAIRQAYSWWAREKKISPPRDPVKVIAMINEFVQWAREQNRRAQKASIPDIDPETGAVLRVRFNTVLPEVEFKPPIIKHGPGGMPLPPELWHY